MFNSSQKQSNNKPKEWSRPNLSKSLTSDDSGFEEDPSVEKNQSPIKDEVNEVVEIKGKKATCVSLSQRPSKDELEHSTDESKYFDVVDKGIENELSKTVETMDPDVLFADEVSKDKQSENMDGLSRRPPEDKDFDEVRMLQKKQSDGFVRAEENLPLTQQTDPELRSIVGFRLRSDEPPDLVFGHPDDESSETYDSYVEKVQENSVSAFAEVRESLQKKAERSKKYYDIGVKPKYFEVGQWVLYFNPRKFRGKQNKWIRQYEGPYLVIKTLSSLTVNIQKSVNAKPKTVQIDKLKAYEGFPPKKWIETPTEENSEVEGIEDSESIFEDSEPSAKVGQTQHWDSFQWLKSAMTKPGTVAVS